jgi:aryl-alcohol dehydrogenase-like predicted oxidoreductase
MTNQTWNRRQLLGGAALGISGLGFAASSDIPYRTLGRTGEKVSAIGLGGYHLGIPKDPEESVRIVRSAIDRGINFMDNCWDYFGGQSEIRMGKALAGGYRKKVFLMSKLDGHTKALAAAQIDESLKRLGTDHLDLMQIHEVIRMGDPERVFAPGGTMEAMLAAKKAGKIRYIGFTGHKDPAIHLHMLDVAAKNKFRFDTVQMPLNVMDAHFRSFAKQVLPRLVKEQIGVLGMKSLAFGRILESKTATPVECRHYALNLPTSVVICGCDSLQRLDEAIEAVRTFKPMSEAEVAAILSKTATAAQAGKFELFKTDTMFDGTDQHPEWVG